MSIRSLFVLKGAFVAVGLTSVVISLAQPAWDNETNGSCWIAMFLLCAPYGEQTLRWLWVSIGISGAVVGIALPTWLPVTTNVCWAAMFLLCAPYLAQRLRTQSKYT